MFKLEREQNIRFIITSKVIRILGLPLWGGRSSLSRVISGCSGYETWQWGSYSARDRFEPRVGSWGTPSINSVLLIK